MQSAIETRHAHFQRLFLDERSRREAIRSSISTPVAAISFAVFAFSTLATEFDIARWRQPASLAIILLACGSIAALFAAAYQVIMVEWLFVYHEPPDLGDLLDAEAQLSAADRRGGPEEDPDRAAAQFMALLTASYAVAYEQYLRGNAASARSRTWALRLVIASLMMQAMAFLLLPVHSAG